MNQIFHFKVEEAMDLFTAIKSNTNLTDLKINTLLELGSIYLNSKRILTNQKLPKPSIVRLHLNPRRFPNDRLKLSQIMFENDEFIVVNKPSGIPTQASVDNIKENLLVYLSEELDRKLYITNRLDIGTSGLIIFAKNPQFQTWYNQQLSEGLVEKKYLAETRGPLLERGILQHWMIKHPRAPKKLSKTPLENAYKCVLEILSAQNLTTHNLYEIRLLTGRTHQIRAQLSFEQNPIAGDLLYGGVTTNETHETYRLKAYSLAFKFRDEFFHFSI